MGTSMLFLNFGDEQRATSYLERKLADPNLPGDSVIKTFDVRTSYVDALRESAVPQELGRMYPDAPQIVDPNQAADQFGLRSHHFPELLRNIMPGSGTIPS